MGIYDNEVIKAVARRSMTIFFIADTSGSMYGSKIGSLNQAIEESIPEIRSISASNADANIQIAVLKFSTNVEWITPAPEDVSTFQWKQLSAEGMTSFGEACFRLEQKLHKEEFMRDSAGCFAPVFFLLSDGAPTDEYKSQLEALKNNNWFKKGIRVAVAIGDDADKNMLEEFTGNCETVLTVHTPEMLRKVIRFVSVTASQVASKSSSVGCDKADQVTAKQDEFISSLKQSDAMEAVDDGAVVGDIEW